MGGDQMTWAAFESYIRRLASYIPTELYALRALYACMASVADKKSIFSSTSLSNQILPQLTACREYHSHKVRI